MSRFLRHLVRLSAKTIAPSVLGHICGHDGQPSDSVRSGSWELTRGMPIWIWVKIFSRQESDQSDHRFWPLPCTRATYLRVNSIFASTHWRVDLRAEFRRAVARGRRRRGGGVAGGEGALGRAASGERFRHEVTMRWPWVKSRISPK